jgi:Transcriptional regulator, AbiEi antitoxin
VLWHAQLIAESCKRRFSLRGMKQVVDRFALAELHVAAASQHGLFTRAQAAGLGLTRETLAAAVERGWLRRVRRGVYAFNGVLPSRWECIMAAALAAGPDAVISHRSAAMIHRFNGVTADQPHLTVPMDRGRLLADVRVHRSRHLDPEDAEERNGVRITTPVRTVIDIADWTGDFLLGRILDEGAIDRLWTPERLSAGLDRTGTSGRSGTARLRRLLAERTGEGIADSRLEQRVLRVLRGNVPDPVPHFQVVLGDSVLDMDLAWPERRIDGEIDGYRTHVLRSHFDRDRLRANLLAAHGWRQVHWTSSMDARTILAQVRPYFAAP